VELSQVLLERFAFNQRNVVPAQALENADRCNREPSMLLKVLCRTGTYLGIAA
jgi:hypothetical protein